MSTIGAKSQVERSDSPMGRDEVVAAILEAAADLFAERGPAATSIREVAKRAGVNHGLIHRHFGSKEQLVGAVLDYLGQHLAELLASDTARTRLDAAIDRQSKVVARTTLDGYPIDELQTRFPNMTQQVERLRHQHPTERSARLAAAHATALQLSWRLFGGFLRASAGLGDLTDDEVAQSLTEATSRLVSPAGP
jgi:TetR/AcrR family transcriptional regulator, repressor for neighboring sulfatase